MAFFEKRILGGFILAAALLALPLATIHSEEPAQPAVEDHDGSTPFAPVQGMAGIVATSDATLVVIDPVNQSASNNMLNHQLGSHGGGAFDVAITPDGNTALVSNFGDSWVFFVDISNPAAPVATWAAKTGMFAEDIAITSDGKYALVTDGGFSTQIALINIPDRTVRTFNIRQGGVYMNAVAIASDNQTIIAADYFSMELHILLLDPAAEKISYLSSIKTAYSRPINVDISPDGKTAIAVPWNSADRNGDEIPPIPIVLRIDAPGVVSWSDSIILPIGNLNNVPPRGNTGGQSVIFDKQGEYAYFLTHFYTGKEIWDPSEGWVYERKNYVHRFRITEPGKAVLDGAPIPITKKMGTSGLFGVDVLAIEPTGRYLYVSNKTVSGGGNQISVIDLENLGEAYRITEVSKRSNSLPTGIAFPNGPSDLSLQSGSSITGLLGGPVLTFTIEISNNGPWTSHGVIVSTLLPQGLEIISQEVSSGSFDSATGRWTIGKLVNGEKQTLAVRAWITEKGPHTGSARIERQGSFDPDKNNNSTSATASN